MILRINSISSIFPDGQQIPKVPIEYKYTEEVITLEYIWKWETLQNLIGVCAVLRKWGKKFELYMPYFPGARADRTFSVGEPNYIRDVIAPIINGLGCQRVIVLDPHSDVVEGCIPTLDIIDVRFLVVARHGPIFPFSEMCLVVPDAGAQRKSHTLTDLFQDVVYGSKHRDPKTGKILTVSIDRKAKGTNKYLIVDDICDGGATFTYLAAAINREDPKAEIHLYVTHGLFSKGLDELSMQFKTITTTNSLGFDKQSTFNLKIINIWNTQT